MACKTVERFKHECNRRQTTDHATDDWVAIGEFASAKGILPNKILKIKVHVPVHCVAIRYNQQTITASDRVYVSIYEVTTLLTDALFVTKMNDTAQPCRLSSYCHCQNIGAYSEYC